MFSLNRTRLLGATVIIMLLPMFIRAQVVKVMTYNIKYDNTNDTLNNWNDRKSAMVDVLKEKKPAFIGLQEVLFRQLEYLNGAMPEYQYIGVGRDDGKQKGEFSPIFYDSNKYDLIKSSTFWLSKTPEEISIGWDAAMERICTYGLFQDKASRKKIWVFNTHFDHVGVKARKKSVKLIHKQIKQINTEKLPVVLMGDLNLMPEEKPIQFLARKLKDGLLVSKSPQSGPTGTFNGFNISEPIARRIDYIFVRGYDVLDYQHIDERIDNGRHISDHLPVIALLSFEN